MYYIDLSESSSAEVENKGNENDLWIPVSIVEQNGVVLVFGWLIVSDACKRQRTPNSCFLLN